MYVELVQRVGKLVVSNTIISSEVYKLGSETGFSKRTWDFHSVWEIFLLSFSLCA